MSFTNIFEEKDLNFGSQVKELGKLEAYQISN